MTSGQKDLTMVTCYDYYGYLLDLLGSWVLKWILCDFYHFCNLSWI